MRTCTHLLRVSEEGQGGYVQVSLLFHCQSLLADKHHERCVAPSLLHPIFSCLDGHPLQRGWPLPSAIYWRPRWRGSRPRRTRSGGDGGVPRLRCEDA